MSLLGVEGAIITRLKAQLPAGTTVASGAAVAGAALDVATLVPAVVVQPGNATVVSSSHNSRKIVEEQVWIVAAIMKLTPDADGLLVNNYFALNALATSVVRALVGFASIAIMRPLKYAGRDALVIGTGLVETPLRFTTRVY